MEKTTTVTMTVLNYLEDNYSKILTNLQLNISTLMPPTSPAFGEIEYNEFVRRCSDFLVLIILFLIGTVGNVNTILVYLRVSYMKERFQVRTLIIWLCAVDLTTCLVVMPFEMFAIRFSFSISSTDACKFFRYIPHITVLSSWLILTAIGHERYKSIYGILLNTKSVVPSKICKVTSWLNGKSTFYQHNLVCFLIVISTSVGSTPTLIMLGIEPLPLKNGTLLGTECTTHKQYRGKLTAGLYGAAIGSFGSLCFGYCSFCYGKILYLIYKQSKKEKTRRENSIQLRAKVHKAQQTASYRRRKPHYKVTISLIVATGVSLFGFILYSIGAAFGGASDSALKRAIITGVLKRGCFINNACNPVIYFICDNKFRHACKKLYMK